LTEKGIMKEVTIYTDGACSGNPGPGGWAAVLKYGNTRRELSGGEPNTTNNRMELLAVIYGLEALKEPCRVTLRTDSQYIARAINEKWITAWRGMGWKRKDGELKNADLWQRLDKLLIVHSVEFEWVKGHSDNEENKRCDELAVAESRKYAI